VSGLLVLLITVLVADQVVKLRQINERSRVVAAQAAIVTSQAVRASQAISQILTGSGNREMVCALASVRSGGSGGYSPGRLDDAVRQLKAASAPLLQVLDPETQKAVRGDQAG
jgi:hypothetical protein